MRVVRESPQESVLLISRGRLDASGLEGYHLEQTLSVLYKGGCQVVTLDFSEVSGIDRNVIGLLLSYHKRFKEKGGELRIKNITSPPVWKTFQMLQLHKVIPMEEFNYQEVKNQV